MSRRRGWCVGRGDEWRRYAGCKFHGMVQAKEMQDETEWGYKKIVNGVVGRMPSDFKGTVANDIINRVFITGLNLKKKELWYEETGEMDGVRHNAVAVGGVSRGYRCSLWC